ncbi:MAG TPA: hypothetical protein VFM30_08445 [Steroidobacteraceae bacterium]|nr:hypothetical protein [Steroidobacteraceae bacterium]
MKRALIALSFLLLPGAAAQALDTPNLDTAVEQLRQAAGRWNVTTTRYADNGAVAAVATGTWSFDWVVPDRVLSGRSTIPDWNQSAGMLFYLNERVFTLEMAQVGADGQLVVMKGRVGTETRTTAPVALPDGRRVVQRHTRYGIGPDRFEAKMETSYDGGQNWKLGYHQLFVRAPAKVPESGARMQHRTRPQPYVPLT